MHDIHAVHSDRDTVSERRMRYHSSVPLLAGVKGRSHIPLDIGDGKKYLSS